MTTSTSSNPLAEPATTPYPGGNALGDGSLELDAGSAQSAREMQQTFLRAVARSRSKTDALQAMSQAVFLFSQPVSMLYYQRDESGQLSGQPLQLADNALDVNDGIQAQLLQFAEAASSRGNVVIEAVDGLNAFAAVAVPVNHHRRRPEAICALVLLDPLKIDVSVVALEMLSANATLWHLLHDAQVSESEVQTSAALVELLSKIQCREDLRQAGLLLVSELQAYFQCERVAFGLTRKAGGPVKLQAVSGLAVFDDRTESARALEAVMDEAIIRDSLTIWPPPSQAQRHSALAHQRLSDLCGKSSVASLPIRNEVGEVVGAIVCIGTEEVITELRTLTFLRFCEVPLGSCFDLAKRAQPGPLRRLRRLLSSRQSGWKWKSLLAAVFVLAAAMAIPFPYRIACDCETQPVMRRYVAAPFDATLEKALVRAGDVVKSDQVLARLDGREIRWELASLQAEHESESKKRDAALAKHDIAAAQLAKLAMERVELKQRLLEHRSENLHIKSPLEGIVISGEIDRDEGAPLTTGQTLFEIAPLDEMVVEVGIPQNEIAYVETGMDVVIHLEAYPQRSWQGKIQSIHPRSEMGQYESVFVAEVELDNQLRELRPGMNGTAKISGRWYPLGWNLFHNAWESLHFMWGW